MKGRQLYASSHECFVEKCCFLKWLKLSYGLHMDWQWSFVQNGRHWSHVLGKNCGHDGLLGGQFVDETCGNGQVFLDNGNLNRNIHVRYELSVVCMYSVMPIVQGNLIPRVTSNDTDFFFLRLEYWSLYSQ